MSNEFFTPSGLPAANSDGLSSEIRSEFLSIAAGFDKLPTMTGNGSELVRVNAGGTGLETWEASGTWTPTLTGIANVAAVTAFSCPWIRIGNVVTLGLYFTVDPTASSTLTDIKVTLPVAASFGSFTHLNGSLVVNTGTTLFEPALAFGDISDDTATVRFIIATTDLCSVRGTVTYLI